MEKLGFIGLGVMGKPMCRNLIRAGYSLVVYDIVKDAVQELASEGAQAANSPAMVAELCDKIITMLPNSPQVREVLPNNRPSIQQTQKSFSTITVWICRRSAASANTTRHSVTDMEAMRFMPAFSHRQ